MAVTRVFLGWDRPLCETAPEWLLQGGGPGTIDLRKTAIVVPTRQSSWRLHAALPLFAHDRYRAALIGPDIVTAPVLLTPPPRPGCASELQSLLVWCAVLKSVPAGELDAFLGKQRPSAGAWAMQVASRLTALRRELADGALSIAEVADRGSKLEELERWQAMAELERRYLACLGKWSLRDAVADQLAYARTGQLESRVRRVVLAAVPDPPRLLMSLLQRWAETGGTVEVLVAAPERESAAFDDWGRPRPEAWEQRHILLDDQDIVLAANPEDQAARIAGLLKDGLDGWPGGSARRRPALAIGVPDRETVAPLQRELAALGLPAFDPQNRLVADTPLFRLVQSLLAWRERPGYAETAALLRHPDVLADVRQAEDVLRALDEVQTEHLPVTFDDLRQATETAAKPPSGEKAELRRNLSAALTRLEEWRIALAHGKPLAAGLRDVLQAVYDRRMLRADEPADNAFQQAASAVDSALRELAEAEESDQAGTDAAAALVQRLQAMTVRPERAGEPLDLEGWLELAWNPAPVLCVAGMNEGFVPDGHVGDIFLPDSLRRQLDLRDDRLRVARDAYLLTVLCAQRSDRRGNPRPRVVLLVGKRSAAGDPLRPSRLLFRCPNDALVRRAQALFGDPPNVHTAAAYAVSFALDPKRLPPEAIHRALLDRISATAFKDYLSCPFRFYLRHVLNMRPMDDLTREPDAAGFGTLCHAVLETMGKDKGRIWACGDVDGLADWLERRLREEAVKRYGDRPWLGVTLAVESAARRLRAFAARQVAWHAAGWEIVGSELPRSETRLEGASIGGRIDRIDRNRDGQVCVLDYKTTDKAAKPDQTHLATAGDDEKSLPESFIPGEVARSLGIGGTKGSRPKRWADLQLPLYREMLRTHYGADVKLGYILLPAALGETTFEVWEGYSNALHEHAVCCAKAILNRIREGIFWPPTARTPVRDDFSDLLLGDPKRFVAPPPNPWQARPRTARDDTR